jgi:hypothetical protein
MTENNGDAVQPAPKKRMPKRMWIALSAVATVIILELLSANTIGFHLTGQDAGPKANEVAKDFKPRHGWKLISEKFDDSPYYCLLGACSENIQTWDVGTEPVTCEELQGVLRDSGFKVFTHRNNYTPEANLELKTCKDTMLPGLTAEADARNGWMHVDASVSPPGYDSDSLPDRYRLRLRIAR